MTTTNVLVKCGAQKLVFLRKLLFELLLKINVLTLQKKLKNMFDVEKNCKKKVYYLEIITNTLSHN